MAVVDEMINPYTKVALLKYNQNREEYVFLKFSQVFRLSNTIIQGNENLGDRIKTTVVSPQILKQ